MLDHAITARSDIADKRLLRSFSYIDGKWRAAESGATFAVRNPANLETIGDVASLSGAEARSAVDAAQRAFGGWAQCLPQDRSAVLRRWHDLILAHREDLARIMVLEQGKPLSEARGEIDYAASFVEFYAEEAKRPDIEGVTSHLPDAEVELWLEPVGVVALITPWNFPSAMLTRKAAAALAAGCTIVAHPSGETPYSALALAELAERAGLPAGVLNVVTGDPATIVEPWTQDTRVRALSFTGSTGIGKLLYRQSADTVKRLVLELGGHAPVIVFADADLDAAVAKQAEHVADALSCGARLACGGAAHPAGPLFYQPTVLTDVPDTARIMREETFGPVAAITPFDTEEEVIRRANDTEYGLVAYLHSIDPRRIYRLSRALQFGMVAVNRTKVTGAPIPFGGTKQSGLGREGAATGMREFMEIKYVCRDWA